MTRSGGFGTVQYPIEESTTSCSTRSCCLRQLRLHRRRYQVTTLAVMFIALVAEARGDFDMNNFRRRIPPHP